MDSRVAYWVMYGTWPTDQQIVEMHKYLDRIAARGCQILDTSCMSKQVHDSTGTWTPQQKAAQYDQLIREHEDGV